MAQWIPGKGARLAPAWEAADRLLADGDWHTWDDLISAMLRASDITLKTCDGLLYQGVQYNHFVSTGRGRSRKIRKAEQ